MTNEDTFDFILTIEDDSCPDVQTYCERRDLICECLGDCDYLFGVVRVVLA